MRAINKQGIPPHYIVTVEGAYAYKNDEGEKARKSYKFDIPVPITVTANIPTKAFDARTQTYTWPDVQKTLRIEDFGILSYLVKEKILENRIRKEHPDFIVLLRHEITNIRTSGPEVMLPSNPYVLNKGQLEKFIRANGWPIETSLFPTLKDLREAVMNYKEGPESYHIFEENRRRRNAAGNAFTKAQLELEDLYAEEESENASFPEGESLRTEGKSKQKKPLEEQL